jgi:hypothetical protein
MAAEHRAYAANQARDEYMMISISIFSPFRVLVLKNYQNPEGIGLYIDKGLYLL